MTVTYEFPNAMEMGKVSEEVSRNESVEKFCDLIDYNIIRAATLGHREVVVPWIRGTTSSLSNEDAVRMLDRICRVLRDEGYQTGVEPLDHDRGAGPWGWLLRVIW